MEATSSTRILTAPLYVDGRIVGIVDARDKAGREPFVEDDVQWMTEVLRRLAVKVRTIPQFSPPSVGSELELETSIGRSDYAGQAPSEATRAPALEEAQSYLPSGTVRTL